MLAVSMAGFTAHTVWAAGPVLVQGPQAHITAEDIEADALRMPEEMRASVLSRPKTVSQIASNLYARRALANKAQAEGLASDPHVAAALQVARDKVLSDALLAKIDKDSAPSDAVAEGQARNIYKAKPDRFQAPEQVQVRHILIAGTDGGARAQAEKVLEELKAGADFAQLAKERSADTGSGAKGGDLGLFARGRMVPEFDEAAFALKQPGDLSGIVETKFGFHILKLDARRPAGLRSYEEVREELIKEVRGKLQQDARVAEAEKAQQGLTINNEAVEAFTATHKAAP
uniref:peptidylprolyl isomerase n=1 Tax=uncultured Acidovorax sp. TaxID=158751 RepID=UPI000AB8BAD4|nr:peptidylprolyl isomerase [uncultured Acidovorax sp.]